MLCSSIVAPLVDLADKQPESERHFALFCSSNVSVLRIGWLLQLLQENSGALRMDHWQQSRMYCHALWFG